MNITRPLSAIGRSTLKAMAVAAAMVALAGTAHAALVNLGNGTVKDDITNLIWLRDWNVNGSQDWATQKVWAETTLDGFAGSNDWALPSISEYAALFAAYGYGTLQSQFTNVGNLFLWSGTELTPGVVSAGFYADTGFQSADFQTNRFFAVAVRSGDVATPVPEPQTLALALLALSAAVVVCRRRPG